MEVSKTTENNNEVFLKDKKEKQIKFEEMLEKRKEKASKALEESPLHKLSKDFYCRFIRDYNAVPRKDEAVIKEGWSIVYLKDSAPVIPKMAFHLAGFFERSMRIPLPTSAIQDLTEAKPCTIILCVKNTDELCSKNRDKKVLSESFTITVKANSIVVTGVDPGGLRSGVVRLIGIIGLRQAPYVRLGETNYTPRIPVRIVGLGGIPNDIFYGGNSVVLGSYELYALSTSNSIPELSARKDPEAMKNLKKQADLAREYSLGMYVMLFTREKFAGDDSLFDKYPDIRGALTWKEDGHYTLCTEHPLVQKYLKESVKGLFKAIPDLKGIIIIIGGEGFYHCFMRPYGVKQGHTNCKRCEPLGAERVVANLCNMLSDSIKEINPQAEVVAWPYSASSVWSADLTQKKFMYLLKPGVSIMTEMEKDEIVYKAGAVEKLLWDYSIDLIGPGKRAAKQLEVSKETGVPVYILSMAEMSFEAPLLPSVPVLDRWSDRAEALAKSGAKGVYLWNMAPFNGLSSGEVYQYKWFSPAPSTDSLLLSLASRITGNHEGGKLLRRAWQEVSAGFSYMPTINDYYKGPHYLGPAHPTILSPDIIGSHITVPDIFKGYYLFLGEINLESAMDSLPTYVLTPETITGYSGPECIPVLEVYYRVVQDHLKRALDALDKAEPMIREISRNIYEAETLGIRWFYHTVRSIGNFYELFSLTNRLKEKVEEEQTVEGRGKEWKGDILERILEVMMDEKQNAIEALPIAEKDPRIDTLYRGDHSFNSLVEMLQAKILLIEQQILIKYKA